MRYGYDLSKLKKGYFVSALKERSLYSQSAPIKFRIACRKGPDIMSVHFRRRGIHRTCGVRSTDIRKGCT